MTSLTLEKNEDLNQLFDVIQNYKDSFGNYPIMTFNMVMGNPVVAIFTVGENISLNDVLKLIL